MGGKIMKRTYFYNAKNEQIKKMAGIPSNADTFEKNAANATRVEILNIGAYNISRQSFFLIEGRWLTLPEKSGEKYFRYELKRAKVLMHISREEVSNEEMSALLTTQSKTALEAARKEIAWCNDEDEHDEHGRYWLSAYRGAITYRLIVKDGRIRGSIPGGFHNSHKPIGVCQQAWENALRTAVEEVIGTGFVLPKADGSGTYFYLRNSEDTHLLRTKEYDVPDLNTGGIHHNIEIH